MLLAGVTDLVRRLRFGDGVIVVSGLPRSGTSMLMNMLEAGGASVMADHIRASDADNPKGYFEYERVKELDKNLDKSWVRAARGKAIKVISHLLTELPDDNYYKVILMRRDLDEVLASQNIMLARRGEPNPVTDEKARELYARHLINIKVLARRRRNFDLLEVHYREAVGNPLGCARKINAFLGGLLDVEAMAIVIDGDRYHIRKGLPPIAPLSAGARNLNGRVSCEEAPRT